MQQQLVVWCWLRWSRKIEQVAEVYSTDRRRDTKWQHDADTRGEFKAKVALEALRGDKIIQEIAARHKVHPNQVSAWKQRAVKGLREVFSKGAERSRGDHEAEVRDLHAKIRELTVERDFLSRGLKW